jgi:DNA-3-methyladenine glycosylase II
VARISFIGASRALAERDEAMARMFAVAGPFRPRPPMPTAFEALVRSVVFQQISTKAAAAIHNRLVAALGTVSAESVLATPESVLRAAGLSASKAASLIDLAVKTSDGTVMLESLNAVTDEELIDRLVVIRGIGRWTAEMLLIFQFRRLDVWPVDDLGVRKGYALAHGLHAVPSPKSLVELGEVYRPYRSVAAWYMWRAVTLGVPGGDPWDTS